MIVILSGNDDKNGYFAPGITEAESVSINKKGLVLIDGYPAYLTVKKGAEETFLSLCCGAFMEGKPLMLDRLVEEVNKSGEDLFGEDDIPF